MSLRRRKKQPNDQGEVNMTPMLDIVFILLIFFIVTATFLQEQGIDMRPPPTPDEPPETDNVVILVQIDGNSNVFVNQDATTPDRVLAAVSRIRAEQPNSAVLLQPDDQARHGIIVQLWDEMNQNSIPVSINRSGSD